MIGWFGMGREVRADLGTVAILARGLVHSPISARFSDQLLPGAMPTEEAGAQRLPPDHHGHGPSHGNVVCGSPTPALAEPPLMGHHVHEGGPVGHCGPALLGGMRIPMQVGGALAGMPPTWGHGTALRALRGPYAATAIWRGLLGERRPRTSPRAVSLDARESS